MFGKIGILVFVTCFYFWMIFLKKETRKKLFTNTAKTKGAEMSKLNVL